MMSSQNLLPCKHVLVLNVVSRDSKTISDRKTISDHKTISDCGNHHTPARSVHHNVNYQTPVASIVNTVADSVLNVSNRRKSMTLIVRFSTRVVIL